MLSKNIIPYNDCVEGIKESLSDFELQVINIEGNLDTGRALLKDMENQHPDLVIGVGAKASFLLSEKDFPFPRLFCMVLNPEKLLIHQHIYSGISLNILPYFQLQRIKDAFPWKKKIGVFFSPDSNQSFIDNLSAIAASLGLELVKFPIESAKQIPLKIESKTFTVDILLIIPDKQIESKKIVEYIIKKSLHRKIPVVGYNSWFAKNGAILSFIIDYKHIGQQTGNMASKLLSQDKKDGISIQTPDKIGISINLKLAKKLGIEVSPRILQIADEVIK